MTALLMAAAVAVDWLLGEPRRWHPLVGFGRLTRALEARLYQVDSRLRGVLGVALLVLPITAAFALLRWRFAVAAPLIDIALLVFALGHRSLHDHARPIAAALKAGDPVLAQQLTARIVSRDSAAIDPAPAATESVLENGNDGVFGALFWFAILGGPGALLFRLANTLDAMWGYRNARYLQFGWAAARFDDGLNWPAARLTALSYALLGQTRIALHSWKTQAPLWDSPNAGPVMSAGAGALGLQLGGAARYEGEWHQRPVLGAGTAATADDIERALRLVRRSVLLWLAVIALLELARHA
ncbi:MAG: cobalamin biosynthesis protein [Xanthomonadaceae bacterium]|nr:cobalamin biosynthesis protein [Xanthomonadaceae bacterium]